MRKETARFLMELMTSTAASLDESLRSVETAEPHEVFVRYRSAVSKLLTVMLLDVVNPLCSEHPELKPKELL